MKRKRIICPEEIVFRPAVEPMEAAMLTAKEAPARSALHHAQNIWNLDDRPCFLREDFFGRT